MTKANLFDRTSRTIWRWLLAWRRIILAVSALWSAILLMALLGYGPRWLASVSQMLTATSSSSLGRITWALTTLLFGAAVLVQLADWLPAWNTPPANWATWHSGKFSSATRALSRIESLDLPARLSIVPADRHLSALGQPRRATISSPATWIMALQGALGAGLLLMLSALGIVAARGWASDPVELMPGQQQSVPARDGRCSVALQDVRIEPQIDGPSRISAGLSVEVIDGSAHAMHLDQHASQVLQGIQVTWLDHGAAYRIQSTDTEGQNIPLRQLYASQEGNTLRVPFDDAQQEKWAALSDQSLLLRMALVPDADEPYLNAQLIAGASGAVLVEADITHQETLAHDDITVEIVPEAYVQVMLADASHVATSWLALGLVAVGVLGLAIELATGRETVWMTFEPVPADKSKTPIDPSVTTDQRYPSAQWRVGGSAAAPRPGWLENVAANLQGAGTKR